MEKTPKKNNSRLQLVIAAMITAALFLAELYVMINESNNIVLLVGIAVLILIALYFVIDAILDSTNENNIANRELYDDIHRSEKASYMLLKKNLEEISKQVRALNTNDNKTEDNSAVIIKSQKAVAKVAMNKTKETQDRLFIELNNLEASLNDRIRGLSEKLSGFQEEIERLADHIARINEEAILAASKNSQEIKTVVVSEPVEVPVMEEPIIEENTEETFEETFEDTFEDTLEDVLEDSLLEESPLEEVLMETGLEVESEIDDLASLLTDTVGDVEEPVSELDFGDIDLGALDIEESAPIEEDDDILSQLLAAEEAPAEEEIDVLAELTKAEEEVPVAEPESIPTPAPAPAPADNGGKMGQDDIAALIASMTGGDAAPAAEPAPTPKPVDDNPNRMMTPEEIAALIAGTNN